MPKLFQIVFSYFRYAFEINGFKTFISLALGMPSNRHLRICFRNWPCPRMDRPEGWYGGDRPTSATSFCPKAQAEP
jgi:hypothetical protein